LQSRKGFPPTSTDAFWMRGVGSNVALMCSVSFTVSASSKSLFGNPITAWLRSIPPFFSPSLSWTPKRTYPPRLFARAAMALSHLAECLKPKPALHSCSSLSPEVAKTIEVVTTYGGQQRPVSCRGALSPRLGDRPTRPTSRRLHQSLGNSDARGNMATVLENAYRSGLGFATQAHYKRSRQGLLSS
jgi:hypothetical protein